jgi:hypothetical protein
VTYRNGGCIIFVLPGVGVNSKCDRGKEDYEEKFNAQDTYRDRSVNVSHPPYYEKGLDRNGLISQHVSSNQDSQNADKWYMFTIVARATYGSPNSLKVPEVKSDCIQVE